MFYVLALFNVFIAAVAQMLLKKAAITPHATHVKEYLNPWVIGGYSLMVISLVSNIYVLSNGVLLKELGTIDPQPKNHWRFVPEDWTTQAIARERKILFGKPPTEEDAY